MSTHQHASVRDQSPSSTAGVRNPRLSTTSLNSSGASALPGAESSGRTLAPRTRRYFESRLGHDFSKVRIHRGERAHRAADALDARAFSLGNDVVLGNGVPSEQHVKARATLAHELAHVAQRRTGMASATPAKLQQAEVEAHAAAKRVASGGTAALRQQIAPHHLLREPRTGAGASNLSLGDYSLELDGVRTSKFSTGNITFHTYELYGFDTNEHQPKINHLLALASIARLWRGSSFPPKIFIEGSADKIGEDEDNLALGQRRADTVSKTLAPLLDTKLPPDIFMFASSAGEPKKGPTTENANLRKVTVRFSTYDFKLKVPGPRGDTETEPPKDTTPKKEAAEKKDGTDPKPAKKEKSGKGTFKLEGGVALSLGFRRLNEKDKETDEKKITTQITQKLEAKLKAKYKKKFSVTVSLSQAEAGTVGGDSKTKGSSTLAASTKFTWHAVAVDGHQLNIAAKGSGEISFVRKEDSSGDTKTEPKGKGKALAEVSYSYQLTERVQIGAAVQSGFSFTKDETKFQLNVGPSVNFRLGESLGPINSLGLGVQGMASPLSGDLFVNFGLQATF